MRLLLGTSHGDLSLLALYAPEAADQGVLDLQRLPSAAGNQITGFLVQAAQVHGWPLDCGATEGPLR